MENGHITRMTFNGQELYSSEQAHSFITELIRNNSGEFEFHRCPVIKGSLSIHITEALLSSVSLLDEMKTLREHFPDPHTVFLENNRDNLALNTDLREFWVGIEHHFQNDGICAADLSDRVGLFLDQILLKFYKLRLAEIIVPRRAFYKTEPLPELAALSKNLDPELKDLVLKLQPIWAEPSVPPEAAPKPVETAPAPVEKIEEFTPMPSHHDDFDRPDFSAVKIYQPSKKLMGNFMHSLKKLMRTG